MNAPGRPHATPGATALCHRLLPQGDLALAVSLALAPDAEVLSRWRTCAGIGLAGAGSPDLRRLLPLIHHRLRPHLDTLPEAVRVGLRAAAVWEAKRLERMDQILGWLLEALESAGVDAVLVKGRVSAGAYPVANLRHCHDLDLLVRPESLASIPEALAPLGYTIAAASAGDLRLAHRDGLGVHFHIDLLPPGPVSLPQAAMLGRTQAIAIGSTTARMLAPGDHLAHLCGHGLAGRASNRLVWTADVALWLADSRLDSAQVAVFLDIVAQANLALAAQAVMRGLTGPFAVTPPMGLAEGLNALAARAGEADAAVLADAVSAQKAPSAPPAPVGRLRRLARAVRRAVRASVRA